MLCLRRQIGRRWTVDNRRCVGFGDRCVFVIEGSVCLCLCVGGCGFLASSLLHGAARFYQLPFPRLLEHLRRRFRAKPLHASANLYVTCATRHFSSQRRVVFAYRVVSYRYLPTPSRPITHRRLDCRLLDPMPPKSARAIHSTPPLVSTKKSVTSSPYPHPHLHHRYVPRHVSDPISLGASARSSK